MLRVIAPEEARQELALTLNEICRRARRMLVIALEAEAYAYVERWPDPASGSTCYESQAG